MHAPKLIVKPVTWPVTVLEARAHCAIDHAEDDPLLAGMIAAATQRLDGWSGILGRCLVTQTWRQVFDGFSHLMRLPLGPVQSIAAIRTFDDAGGVVDVPAGIYEVFSSAAGDFAALMDGAVTPPFPARRGSVSIDYVCGEPVADVPAPLKAAILLMVGDLYRYRETAGAGQFTSIPTSATVNALIAPFRRHLV